MEEIYAREPATEPAAIAREFVGGGRLVYFPWNIGEIFWEVINLDHSILIENAIRWALTARPRVEVHGPGIVDIATRAAGDRLAVHLVNLTNPMMMKGPIRDVIPLTRQTVSVALPAGRTSAAVRLLVSPEPAKVRLGDGRVEIALTPIETNEVVLIEFGG